MKKEKFILIFSLVLLGLCLTITASAQWYLDTATPEEAAAHDKPFQYLQSEIQNKLCNQNWGIGDETFKLLADNPDWQKIVRGKSIFRFDFTGGGDECMIQLLDNAPLYQANLEEQKTTNESMQKLIDQGKLSMDGPEYKQWDKKSQHLTNEGKFAEIKLNLNEDRVLGKSLQDFRTNKISQLQGMSGLQQAVLYYQYPDEDDPDTSYRLAIYIGNFPKYTGAEVAVNFKSSVSQAWKDNAHSGKPIVENAVVWVYSYHYNNIMEVWHKIDWAGLKSTLSE